MGQSDKTLQPPRNILLATDLSSNCDRALDRAGALARQWKARLHVVHALRPDGGPVAWWSAGAGGTREESRRAELVERQSRRDLREPVDDLVVHVDVGEPVSVILDTAASEHCDLIVAGTSGPTFASIILRTTTEKLLRQLPRSLLVVKSRVRGPYRRVLVGTDFTLESRRGLETAGAWFVDADLTLMHALDIPYRSLFLTAGREHEFARLEHDTMHSFLAAAHLPDRTRENLETRIAYGYPEAMLGDFALAHDDVDLTVVGAITRGLVFHMMVGGNASRIVQTVPGDILVVRSDPAS